ncbi:MAG TPA: hypothetical protein DFS52_15700 [Myxococcales bacterium]|nr:hypothetical protein [Myxococcales bacterium]
MRPSFPDADKNEPAVHHLKDFKSFESASISLFRPLTVLIGRNGSGKSNLIEGLELLAVLAGGSSLHEISDLGRGGDSRRSPGVRSPRKRSVLARIPGRHRFRRYPSAFRLRNRRSLRSLPTNRCGDTQPHRREPLYLLGFGIRPVGRSPRRPVRQLRARPAQAQGYRHW